MKTLKYKIVKLLVKLLGPMFWFDICCRNIHTGPVDEYQDVNVQEVVVCISPLSKWETASPFATHIIEESETGFWSWRFVIDKKTCKPIWYRNKLDIALVISESEPGIFEEDFY